MVIDSNQEVKAMKPGRTWLVLGYFAVIGGLLVGIVLGSKVITVISEGAPIARQACIIIDAGHGG